MAAITVTIGRKDGKLLVIGEPSENPQESREAFKGLVADGGKVGEIQLESAELLDSRCGRMKRATFTRGNGEVKAGNESTATEQKKRGRKPKAEEAKPVEAGSEV